LIDRIVFSTHSCNKCAHELAHFGLARDPDQPIVWLDPLPRFVRSSLDCDAADPESGVGLRWIATLLIQNLVSE